jgi:hypothetical protein
MLEHKLQTGVVAILLALIAIAGPVNSQVTGTEDCETEPFTPGFPPETCLDDAGVDPTGTPCADLEAEGCPVPDDTTPPCAPDGTLVGCVLETTTLFACEDLADPNTCEPVVDPAGTLGAAICTALDTESEETDGGACITAALTDATTCPEGSDGAFPDCDGTVDGAQECEEGAEGTFPDCDNALVDALSALNALCDLDDNDAAADDESFPDCDPAPSADAGSDAEVAEGTVDVALDGSGSFDGDTGIAVLAESAGPLTFSWTQTGGVAVVLADDNTASPTFNAPGLSGLQETLVFELTVTDSAGQTSTDTVSVTITNVDTDDTSIGLTVGGSPAELTLSGPEPAPVITPDGATSTPATYFVEIDTSSGVEHLDDGLLDFTVTDPNGAITDEVEDSIADSKTMAGQPEEDIRTYSFGLSLPGRLADGTYTVDGAYDGDAVTPLTFTVNNVAPTITGTPALHNGRASFDAVATALSLTLDDVNAGSYDDSPVAGELVSLTFAVTDALDVPVASGFTFDVDGGETFVPVTSLDLSAEDGNAPVSVPVQVAYDDSVAAGVYTVSAIVTDDNLETDEIAFLTITLVPANFGFSIAVDDGGDGVSIGSVSADNGFYDNGADPLELQITGTLDAATLSLDIADFTSAGTDDVIPADGVSVLVFAEGADTNDPDAAAASGSIDGNVLDLDLTGIALSETSIFIVFSVQVFDGTDGDAYSTTVDLLSTAEE